MTTMDDEVEIVPPYPSPEYYRWYFVRQLAIAQIHLEMAHAFKWSEDRTRRRDDHVQGVLEDMRVQSITYTAEDLATARYHAIQRGLGQARTETQEVLTSEEQEVCHRWKTFYEDLAAKMDNKREQQLAVAAYAWLHMIKAEISGEE